jgi:plastocyanin
MRGAATLLIGALGFLGVAPAGAADVRGSVSAEGHPAADAVVYLAGDVPNAAPPAPAHVVMDQKNLSFSPTVLPVRRGTVIEFTNSDDVQHNVFSPSPVAGRFNLGTYNRGETRSVTMSEPGEAVVLCNIHMEMEAHIVVLDGPYFAVTNAAGAFRIPNVAPGHYSVRVWRDGWTPDTRTVDVGDAEPVELQLDVGR